MLKPALVIMVFKKKYYEKDYIISYFFILVPS